MAGEQKSVSWDNLIKGFWRENPVFVTVLGMCPTLAITNTVANCLLMAAATFFVLVMSNVLIAMFRKMIPQQVRIATYIVIIATFVTIVDYVIQALSLKLYLAVGAYIQLIVVNCIILGRAEAFAGKNTVYQSFLDGIGAGIGFTIALLSLGVVRELLGAGSLLGFNVFGEHFQPWSVMLLPPGGFFVLGSWLILFSYLKERKERKQRQAEVMVVESGVVHEY